MELYPEWHWEAHYIDGTILYQDEHKLKDINFIKLATFRMVHKERPPIFLIWKPSFKLIHFYRHTLIHNTEEHHIMYCFGYEDHGEKTIFVITPYEILITDDVDKIGVY